MSGEKPTTVIEALRAQAHRDLLSGNADLALRVWECEIDDARIRHERARLRFDRFKSMFDSVIGYGTLAIRTLLLLNGGAAIALLAFVGHMASGGTPNSTDTIQGLGLSVWLFGVGALLGASAAGGAYLTQYAYQDAPNDSWNWQRRIAVFLHIASVIFGDCGLYLVLSWTHSGNRIIRISGDNFSRRAIILEFHLLNSSVRRDLLTGGEGQGEVCHPHRGPKTRRYLP